MRTHAHRCTHVHTCLAFNICMLVGGLLACESLRGTYSTSLRVFRFSFQQGLAEPICWLFAFHAFSSCNLHVGQGFACLCTWVMLCGTLSVSIHFPFCVGCKSAWRSPRMCVLRSSFFLGGVVILCRLFARLCLRGHCLHGPHLSNKGGIQK